MEIVTIMDTALRACDYGHQSSAAGIILAVGSVASWFSGEQILAGVLLLGSISAAVANAYFGAKLVKFKRHIDAITYGRRKAKESGIELPPIDPKDFQPDL